MLAIGLVWVLFRRSKWIKKGAETKQAEYDRLNAVQKEKKGLLWRSVIYLPVYAVNTNRPHRLANAI